MGRCRRIPLAALALGLAVISCLLEPSTALAQTQTPGAEPDVKPVAPDATAPAAAEPPSAQPAPSTAPASPVPPLTTPPGPPPGPPPSLIPDGEAPKGPIAPAFPPSIPGIDYGARLRAALKFQSPDRPQQMSDIGEQLDADMYMSGQVHRYFKWLVSITLSYTGTPGASNTINVQPLDVMARFEPLPEFNIYLGRMLVMADRFAPSGPWGVDEFFFPGFFPLVAPPALPRSGPTGRDVGATVWGAPLKGHVKYYLGVYNLNDPASNPLLSGRIQVSLLNGEPNWFHRATYFGTKDLISAGVGAQYQKDGSVQPVPTTTPPTVPKTDDYKLLTGDLTFEKNIGDAGTVSAIGTYTRFYGEFQRWREFWLASLGYMLPKPIGIGKPRVTVRYQRGLDAAPGADASSVIDAQLSYNIAAWFARVALGYRRGETWLPPTMTAAAKTQPSNMLYLGITLADP
jgi:hypothetical protein